MFPKFRQKPVQTLTEIMLLVLMLWPAPILVGHDHGDLTSQISDQQLARHLQSHHGGLATSDLLPTQWHWHWVFPGDGYDGLGDEEIVAQADQMVRGQPMDSLEPAHLVRLQYVSPKESSVRPSVRIKRQPSFQHVALLHSRQSLPEYLGIIRC